MNKCQDKMEFQKNIGKMFKNLDLFYRDIDSLLKTIRKILLNEFGYQIPNHLSKKSKRVFTYTNDETKLGCIQKWYPPLFSIYFNKEDQPNNYFLVSILIRPVCGDTCRKYSPLDIPEITFGRLYGHKGNDNWILQWFNKDSFYNDWEKPFLDSKKLQIKLPNKIFNNKKDDVIVHGENSEYKFDRGYVYREELFETEDVKILLKNAMDILDKLEGIYP